LKLVTNLVNDNTALNERVEKLQGGTPGAGAGDPPPPAPPGPPTPAPGASFYDTIKARLPATGLPG